MKKLTLNPAVRNLGLAEPERLSGLTRQSAALEFFTDFTQVQPLLIESSTSAVEAQRLMQQAHVRLKLVIDREGAFQGVVSLDDLKDRKIVQKVSEGIGRDDISVRDLMTPVKDLFTLDFGEVAESTISDVIELLKDYGQQHILVVDQHMHQVRGIFSASDISRKLHLPIDIQSTSNFFKVFAHM
ncbi:CBS domain-containing protein [Pseudoteredinibacter isoporae]|uniref:CBS domain-containing protein n=1 Tax=Pseudoteredinibacter isoporae TaxID=570281 RepID=UPI003108D4BC